MMTIDEQKVFEDRIRNVIEENGDGDRKEGVGYFFDNYVMRHASPGFDYLLDFAEHYGVSLDWLFGRTDVQSVFGGVEK